MEQEKRTKIALVRGDSLNEWEGKLWENLNNDFEVTGFCSRNNLYNPRNLNFNITRLRTSTDNYFISIAHKYLFGRFQEMVGLEKELVDFDIAHTAEISYYYTLQAIRAKNNNKNLKVVTTVWDNSFGRFEYNYWPYLKIPPQFWQKRIDSIVGEIVNGVDLFLPVTEYSAQMLRDFGVNESRIKILTPAVVMPEYLDRDILEELGLKDKEIYLVVNRMVKEKGVYDVLYGWKIYMRELSNNNKLLLMIGRGPERKNLMRMAKKFGIDGSIKFIEQLPNQKVRQLSKQAKCLILGSLATPVWQEQFGFVLAEAIVNGCPIISTYSGAIPEVVGGAGLLFASGNPVELKKALVKLDDKEMHQRLKRNCEIEKKRFEVGKFRENLIEIYKELLK